MANLQVPPVEADLIGEVPEELSAQIGKVIVAYAKLEHKLMALAGLLLQLDRAETHLALRVASGVDRLELVLDLFAVKNIPVKLDTGALRQAVARANRERDWLAHGVWLRHPETKQLVLRVGRGQSPKDLADQQELSRATFPQLIPYSETDCFALLLLVEGALEQVDEFGRELDHALATFPDRFRQAAPGLKRLGNSNQSDD